MKPEHKKWLVILITWSIIKIGIYIAMIEYFWGLAITGMNAILAFALFMICSIALNWAILQWIDKYISKNYIKSKEGEPIKEDKSPQWLKNFKEGLRTPITDNFKKK